MTLGSVAAFVALAWAAAAGSRAPTGKWNVDFADAQCIAQRDYGSPGRVLKLVLKVPAVGSVVQVAVVRSAIPTPAEQANATITIDDGRPRKIGMLAYSMNGSREQVHLLNIPSADFEPVRHARILTVRSSVFEETFALSQMQPLLKVMDDCVADLRRAFNFVEGDGDPPGLKSRAKSKAGLASLFSDRDYPAVAVVNAQGGRVEFVLLIGEDGRIADCTIVATSRVPSLDSQACALLKARARFDPARGLDGKPAKDFTRGAIVWRMP
jgi:hypothetical protein